MSKISFRSFICFFWYWSSDDRKSCVSAPTRTRSLAEVSSTMRLAAPRPCKLAVVCSMSCSFRLSLLTASLRSSYNALRPRIGSSVWPLSPQKVVGNLMHSRQKGTGADKFSFCHLSSVNGRAMSVSTSGIFSVLSPVNDVVTQENVLGCDGWFFSVFLLSPYFDDVRLSTSFLLASEPIQSPFCRTCILWISSSPECSTKCVSRLRTERMDTVLGKLRRRWRRFRLTTFRLDVRPRRRDVWIDRSELSEIFPRWLFNIKSSLPGMH